MYKVELTKSDKLPKVYMYEGISLETLCGLCILDNADGIFCTVLQRLILVLIVWKGLQLDTWRVSFAQGMICYPRIKVVCHNSKTNKKKTNFFLLTWHSVFLYIKGKQYYNIDLCQIKRNLDIVLLNLISNVVFLAVLC